MKTIIRKTGAVVFGGLLIISALMLISSQNKNVNQKTPGASAPGGLAVLELFTSQGCSSCPPADALLAEYAAAHNEHIIALSFHVDYWNRLGWADPFSNKAYSERQQWYSARLPKGSVYTPQLIVNGRREAVGNNRNAIKNLVQEGLSVDKTETVSIENISIGKSELDFHYKSVNTNRNEILNIALVQKQAGTHIKAGENEGLTVTNHNIVRSFLMQPVSKEGSGMIGLPAAFRPAEYSLVLYVQNKNDLSITTAIMKDLQ